MLPHALMDATDARDGLLRVAYQQGHRDIGWDALCALCEEAVVAWWRDVWERDAAQACALLTDRTTRLVVWLAQHYRWLGAVWRAHPHRPAYQFAVLDLVHTLDVLRAGTWARTETA